MGKIPPFARQIVGRQPGASESLRLYCGADAWRVGGSWARSGYPAVVLPLDAAPGSFDWRFVFGWSVLVIDTRNSTPLDHLRRLGVLLVQAGATRVVAVTSQPGAERGLVFRPAVERMAA